WLMQSEQILDITREALKVAIMLSAPLLVFGLVTGLMVSVFQAVTQISEATLAIVPKMLAIILAFLIFSPWMLDILMNFTTHMFESIPTLVR
ncbi:MAG: flagellar biosynthesis protein FliQ, partial [Bdellovibrionales bacterium]|nr:flagellar biosynthesis protein FliQ [Bdellovibrionales bacterium]